MTRPTSEATVTELRRARRLLEHTAGGLLEHTAGGLLEHTAGGLLEHTAGGLLEHTAGGSVEAAAGGAWAGGAMRRALTEREVMAAAAAAGAHWKEGKTPAGQPVGNVDGDPSGGGLGGGPGRGRMVYRRGKCWASRLRAREGASRRRAGCATRR